MRLHATIKKQLTYLSIILFIALPQIIAAQVQPNYIQFLTDKGLQSNTIYNLFVAKNGLLYIAHSKGLCSFDGNHFTNYYHKDRPYTEVTNIMETDNGTIFCRAFNNVLFKKMGDSLYWFTSIIPYSYGFAPSASFKNNVYSITNDSIILFNAVSNNRIGIALKSSSILPPNKKIEFIAPSTLNNEAGQFIIDDEQKLFRLPKTIPGNIHYSNGEVFFVKNKSVKNINYYTNNEIINIETSIKDISVNYISTTDSAIWICTTNGLFYRKKNDRGSKFNYMFNGFDISDVKQTHEGNFFISTLGQGLLFVPSFSINILNNISQSISCIAGNSDNLFLGAKDGTLIIYNLLKASNENKEKILNGSAIKFIFQNITDNTIFATSNGTQIGNSIKPFLIKDYCIVNKNIVFATNLGMYLFQNEKDNHWINKYIIHAENNDGRLKKLSFSNEHTSTIKYNPSNDKFYINNYSGILEMANGYNDAKKMPEPNCVLKDMCVWNGNLLLATKDKGILKWNGKDYESAFIKNQTTGILYKFETYKNELWVLGEDAVFCYQDTTLKIYNNQVGVNAENFKGIYITENNVYANNGNKIIQFAKESALINNPNPTFILNKVINVNENKSINENSKLSHSENFVSFQFSLIAYSNAVNTHIAYSINNQDIVHLPSDRREINLDFLKPDKYTIEFYIVSNGTTPIKPIKTFTFSIAPPFYYTWWFNVLCSIAALSLIYFAIRRKIKKERAALVLMESKLLLEKELDKSTLTGIKAQMNPHFIFNALNTIQSYIYMNDKKNASVYISKFSDLTRSILDMSTKETISVNEEIHALEIYLSLEKMRFEDSFEYFIHADEHLEKDKVQLPSMLLQPYLENAVKHGLLHRKTNRILKVDFTIENNYLKIIIDDNGIGRKKSEELKTINNKNHVSFAMSANKKRLEILTQQHKEIYLDIIDKYSTQGEALGTQVIIKLPI